MKPGFVIFLGRRKWKGKPSRLVQAPVELRLRGKDLERKVRFGFNAGAHLVKTLTLLPPFDDFTLLDVS
jgi:hypothetical protein